MCAKLKRKTCNKMVKINQQIKQMHAIKLMPAFISLIQAKQTCPPLLNTSDETTPRKQEQLKINCGIALV